MEEQPEQAKKYQEQIQKFWQDFFEDTFKIKKQLHNIASRNQRQN